MTSQTAPQEVLKFDLFKKELHGLLDEVLHEAKTIQNLAADPLVVDRSWILNKFGDKLAQAQYVLEPKPWRSALVSANSTSYPVS